MIVLFQNILLLKQFLACNGYFGLFTKIIKRSGTSFCCTFSAWFFYKNVHYLILHLWTKFQCHTIFPSQDIKQNVLVSSFRQLMMSWTFRFIFDHPLKQWPTVRKIGKDKKNEKLMKIADTSFKYLGFIACSFSVHAAALELFS